MTVPKPDLTIVKPSPALVKVKAAGLSLLTPLQQEVADLDVVDDASYAAADVLLGDIVRARASWQEKIAPILNPLQTALAAAKAAIKGATNLDNEVDGPLFKLETAVKGKMSTYQIAKQLAAARKAQQIETKAQAAKTPQMRQVLAQQAQETKAEAKAPAVEHSKTRTVKDWRHTEDTKIICRGIIAGLIPASVLTVDRGVVQRQFRDDPSEVSRWPGFEVFDEVQIVRKG